MQSLGLSSFKKLSSWMVTSRLLSLAKGAAQIVGVRKQKGRRSIARVESSKRKKTTVLRRISANPAISGELLSDNGTGASFSDLQLNNDVVKALQAANVTKPTVIQMLAIPKILRGRNVLVSAETGSGKTLAYLAPVVSRLRDEEEHHGLVSRIKRPRTIIILPMRELAIQVLAVAKSLCHHARFRVIGLFGGRKKRLMRESLETPCDIIVATPETLKRHQARGNIYLTDVSHIVIDEVDTMWHDDFRPTVLHLLSLLRIQEDKPPMPPAINKGTQVILVGAMLPPTIEKEIEETIPKVKKARSKYLHTLMPHVEHRFLRVRPEDKAEKLLSLIKHKPENKVVVFCNTIPSCDWVANYLAENGVFPIKLHGSVSSLERTERFRLYREGRTNVLVCTDVASRGVDTNFVNHIILFDFPTTAADYIHRSGRTGRVGGPHNCVVTSLVCRKREHALVQVLKDASEKNEALCSTDISQASRVKKRIVQAQAKYG